MDMLVHTAQNCLTSAIVFLPDILRAERLLSAYVLPLAVAAATVMFVIWRMHRHDVATLSAELARSRALVEQREHERDLAQEELFRRLYEERELNKDKVQFQSQLAEYEKYAALAQLALGAAHEINNPLLGILSHLELELKVATDLEAAPGNRAVYRRRQANFLHPARVGELCASRPARTEQDQPAPSGHRYARFLEHQPMLRGKHLTNDVPRDLPHIRADANQLSQVLMNLLLNAAEATPEGGSIRIEASKLTYVDNIEIRVSDTGCGIPADILAHVFEPFFTTKRGRGTGLGLSISQAYVRSHNGEIRVDSVLNHGTTVTLTLPIRQEEFDDDKKEESEIVV